MFPNSQIPRLLNIAGNMALIEKIQLPVPFPPGVTNCYFIPDSTPTLIDTGINTPEALRSLQDGLKRFGAGISGIRRIILTHGHSDHAGSVGAVAAASNAPVFVHYRDRHWALAGSEEVSGENEGLFRGFFKEAGVPEEIAEKFTAGMLSRFRKHFSPVSGMELLKGSELFSFDHFQLKVIHTPGHTAGSICLFDDTNGTLLSGDSLIEGVTPYICAELKNLADGERYYGLEQYERSLELLRSLPVRLVLPGHGAPFSSHRKLIARVLRDRGKRRKRIREILVAKKQQGAGAGSGDWGDKEAGRKPTDSRFRLPALMSQYEIASRLFLGAPFGGGLFMVISEVHGCLETMEKEGLVASVVQNGKRLYQLNCEYEAKEEAK